MAVGPHHYITFVLNTLCEVKEFAVLKKKLLYTYIQVLKMTCSILNKY